ncbi:hypothetical protein PROFUN_01409 [Planoprotostelium fungivorum]|uniref:Purple acid phosphatase N-terminal domain-containing protein n=1 Tax=Planoprotostelium fungivorum TaxID=1890364 RepID=A0A2P6NT51_9EUKA|nr:hypothetical protein PROFUN_01409 [Planoprotostelium fungivorum]
MVMGPNAPFIGQYSAYFFLAACAIGLAIVIISLLIILGIFIALRLKCLGVSTGEDSARLETMNGSDDKKFDDDPPTRSTGFNWRGFIIFYLVWVAVFAVAWVLMMLCVWRAWPIGAGIPVTLLFVWTAWVILIPTPATIRVPRTHTLGDRFVQHFKLIPKKITMQPLLFVSVLIGLFLFVFIPVYFGYGVCVSLDPVNVTTKYSRSRLHQYCVTPGVCHTHITLPEDPSTEAIINIHTHELPTNGILPTVFFDTVSHGNASLASYANRASGRSWIETNCDGLQRGIHWIDLSNLTPNTVYYFRAGYGSDATLYSREKNFKTLPLDTGNITFITGGDLGLSEMTKTLMIRAAAQDPAFALIGGDVAYANAMSSCYRLWDEYLDWWESYMVAPDGRSIGQILAIGNHEAGGFGTDYRDIPHFLSWFPQQLNQTLEERLTFHPHQVGRDGVLLCLDSSITTLSGQTQDQWMDVTLSSSSYAGRSKKFAVYHVPMYPSFRPFDGSPMKGMRDSWIPVFDRHNMTFGFENHDHAYKRTIPMKNSAYDPEGTIYIGDGAWGVPVRPSLAAAAGRFYLNVSASIK